MGVDRQNPAVIAKAQQCFTAIVLALEAETIQGQTAKKIAELAKSLATMPAANVNADSVLAALSEDGQRLVRSLFS